MLNSKGFDLWAGGYDKSVSLSDESDTYPFAGYKVILAKAYAGSNEKDGGAAFFKAAPPSSYVFWAL